MSPRLAALLDVRDDAITQAVEALCRAVNAGADPAEPFAWVAAQTFAHTAFLNDRRARELTP